MLWDKYKPKHSNEVIGQSISKVKESILANKPVLIHGPTGTGKTITAYALAEELGYNLLEINASDERGKDDINQVIGTACVTNTLFGKRLILIDDVDAIPDRGGVTELINCLKKSKVPIIMTATDIWSSKLKTLRSACTIVEYKRLRITYITKILKEIVQKEGLKIDDKLLYKIASQVGGDLRAAINDLELIKHSNEDEISVREKEGNVFEALRTLFKTNDFFEALHSFDNINMDFSETSLWITENITNEYKLIEEIAKAYDNASRADVFMGRIRRWQYWRFLVYFNALMTAGVSCAKKEPRKGFTPYKRPTRILKLWTSKTKRATAKSIAEKISSKCHLSISKSMKEVMPFLRLMINNKQLINELELTPDEVKFMK